MLISLFAPWPARFRSSGPVLGVLSLFALGCSWIGGPAESSASSPYQNGVLRLATGDFGAAALAFRESASSCESGREGRQALLFLSLLELDPRNPDAHPDSAALMAVRFLSLPSTLPEEMLRAEGMYLAALDRGADPELRPDPETGTLALRFERCGEPPSLEQDLALPVLDLPTSGVLQNLDAENRALQRTVEELQAELERIRGLLKLPDTTAVRLPTAS